MPTKAGNHAVVDTRRHKNIDDVLFVLRTVGNRRAYDLRTDVPLVYSTLPLATILIFIGRSASYSDYWLCLLREPLSVSASPHDKTPSTGFDNPDCRRQPLGAPVSARHSCTCRTWYRTARSAPCRRSSGIFRPCHHT